MSGKDNEKKDDIQAALKQLLDQQGSFSKRLEQNEEKAWWQKISESPITVLITLLTLVLLFVFNLHNSTKDDINAVKDDINAVKEQVYNHIPTQIRELRTELKKDIRELKEDNQRRFDEIEEQFDEIEEQFNEIKELLKQDKV